MPEEILEEKQTQNGIPNSISKQKIALVILVILVCIWFIVKWWIRNSTHIETDNAFIEARVVSISPKVSGTVKRVMANDNQFVKQGDLLVEIDESDYRVRVSSATAGVAMAENENRGEFQKAEVARATVQLAKAKFDQSMLDLNRGEALYNREVIPKEQLDRLKTAKTIAGSQFKEAEESLKRALAEAGLSGNGGNKAKVLQKKAQLEEAGLQLSYTRVTAPRDGYITRKGIEAGSNIQAGQPLMALVPLQDVWITANYKEGQLTHIKPGLKVEFTADSYPGKIFSGRVDSIMAGTGAAFSLLPPENATGNYVKVVQRVPVKITIDPNSDPEHTLRVGMSIIPSILVERSLADIFKGLNPFK